jgi:hypothetical protein
MDYSVHFCLNDEELFQVYSAPIPRVGDHLSIATSTTDWLDPDQTTLAAILSGASPNTFLVRRVTHAWHWGSAGKRSLYITVALAAMREDQQ